MQLDAKARGVCRRCVTRSRTDHEDPVPDAYRRKNFPRVDEHRITNGETATADDVTRLSTPPPRRVAAALPRPGSGACALRSCGRTEAQSSWKLKHS